MSSVRNKGSLPEVKLLAIVKGLGLTGWRRNYSRAFGAPDLAFPRAKVAIFVDGCFWHGCSCKTIPQTNREFWQTKISANLLRDERVDERLNKLGWTLLRVKEHELKDSNRVANLIVELGLKTN